MTAQVRQMRLASDEGFTLTEIIVTLTLLGMVVAASYMVLLTVGTMSDQIEARSVATEESRLAFDRMTRELRQAQEIDEGHGAVERAQPRLLAFYCDLNQDFVPERVTYYVDGDSLYRSVAPATTEAPPFAFGPDSDPELIVETLQDGWADAVFTYFDGANPPEQAAAVEEVSAVEIHLINSATVNRKTVSVDSETMVKIRSVHNRIS